MLPEDVRGSSVVFDSSLTLASSLSVHPAPPYVTNYLGSDLVERLDYRRWRAARRRSGEDLGFIKSRLGAALLDVRL